MKTGLRLAIVGLAAGVASTRSPEAAREERPSAAPRPLFSAANLVGEPRLAFVPEGRRRSRSPRRARTAALLELWFGEPADRRQSQAVARIWGSQAQAALAR